VCKFTRASKNAYDHWFKNKDSIVIETAKKRLKKRIKVIFEDSREIYGSHPIQKKLEREGLKYCRSYIGLLMKEMGLKSVLKRKFVATTDSNHAFPTTKSILNRDFESLQIGEKCISDITYIRVNDDWDDQTTIIDLADKKVVSCTLSQDMTAQNTIIKAWYLARSKRQIKNSFIFHLDGGVQYASNKMTNLFSFNSKITQSMSRKDLRLRIKTKFLM
jgi:putative transposase